MSEQEEGTLASAARRSSHARAPRQRGASLEDRRRLEGLHREHGRQLVRYLISQTGNPDLAEDLAQDTFVRAAVNLDQLDPGKSAWPWLRTIAHNLIVDHHRKHRRECLEDDRNVRINPSREDPLDNLLEGWLLAGAIELLPDRQRLAIELRYLDGWKSGEAAELFGLSRPAFEQLLYRARACLRANYERLTRSRTRRA